MTGVIVAVFLASVLGSLHCAGMCGAFVAIAVADTEGKPGRRLSLNAAYHGGRLVTYVTLGSAAGAVGALLDLGGALVGISRVAMILAGAVMILFGVSAAFTAMGKRSPRIGLPRFTQRWLHAGHRAAMGFGPVPRAMLVGLLTTLLPCGWLYAFAAVAAGTAHPLLGATTMAVFWLGTLPVMVSLGMGVQRLSGVLGRAFPHATAAVLIIAGLWTLSGRSGLDAAALASTDPIVSGDRDAQGRLMDALRAQPDCGDAP